MPFIRRKRGQVLLVHNVRVAGESRVQQRELYRFSSASELEATLGSESWGKWTRSIEWNEQDVTFDWDSLKEKLVSELQAWNAAPNGSLHRRDGKIERLATELTAELATLSVARAADAAFVERAKPLLDALHQSLMRLLPSSADRNANLTNEDATMMNDFSIENDSAECLFDVGMEHWWDGDRRSAASVFRRVLKGNPRHADAHNHLGIVSLDGGKLKAAERHFRAAIAGGSGSLERVGDQVPWGHIENRPYLRGLGNLALTLAAQKRWREAAAVHEEMLRINPDDNQGVRFLIGLEHLRVGDLESAIRALRRSFKEEPGCAFGLALATLRSKGPTADVGEALLHGFAHNRYVAPMLLGEKWERLDGFHGTSMAEPEWAKDVIDGQADLWQAVSTSAEVLRFWWQVPPVAEWRRQIDRTIIELKDIPPSEQRSAIVSRSMSLRSSTTVTSLVRQVRKLS